jgi:hypothetical protein
MTKEYALGLNEYAEFELVDAEHLAAVAGGDIFVYGPEYRNWTCTPDHTGTLGGANLGFCLSAGNNNPLVYEPAPVTVGIRVLNQGTYAEVPGVVSTAGDGYLYVGVNGLGGLHLNGACIDNVQCGSNVPC